MTNHILQWNCRSVKANVEELNLLVNEKKPVAVCLQETFLRDSDKFTLKYHSVILNTVVTMIKLQEVSPLTVYFEYLIKSGILVFFQIPGRKL